MSETLTVYFVSRTGHVLGAVTRAAGAVPAAPRAVSLEDVLVRGVKTSDTHPTLPSFPVPAAELSTLTLPPRPSLLPQPLDFQVSEQIDDVEHLPPDIPAVELEISTTTATVTVTAPSTVGQDTAVWVLIIGGPLTTPRIGVGVIKKGSDKTDPPLTVQPLPKGAYHVLALVRGYRPSAITKGP